MTDLRAFITETDRKIVAIFNATGVIHPMWHSVNAAGEHRVIAAPPTPDKDVAAALMRCYFELENVVRYVFVDEAWTIYLPIERDNELPEIMQRGLAEHPDRIEVLMYQAESDDGAMVAAHRTILRRPHGKPRLGPLEFIESKIREGRLVGMLPRRGTVQ